MPFGEDDHSTPSQWYLVGYATLLGIIAKKTRFHVVRCTSCRLDSIFGNPKSSRCKTKVSSIALPIRSDISVIHKASPLFSFIALSLYYTPLDYLHTRTSMLVCGNARETYRCRYVVLIHTYLLLPPCFRGV